MGSLNPEATHQADKRLTDINSVLPLVKAINNASFSVLECGKFENEEDRQLLLVAAEKLAIAARRPEENLYHLATNTALNSAIRSAIGLGIFTAVPQDGTSISAGELAERSGAEKSLIVRIVRALTSAHIFQETGDELYTHNALSIIYASAANRDMTAQMYDFLGKAVYHEPEYLAKTGWKDPTDPSKSAFHSAHDTKLDFFDFLQEDPERLRMFNSGMRSLATSTNPYTFDDELRDPCGDEEVLIVDVGGGRGQALELFKDKYPELKGKMVLQDLASVIEDAKRGGLPKFITPQAASFTKPQPIKGARIYHFRRIFHDWNDEVSREILSNTTASMGSNSKVLISDTVVPNEGAPRDQALQDINMMSFGGMERTEKQWGALLASVDLKIVKIWRTNADKHAMIEAKLNC